MKRLKIGQFSGSACGGQVYALGPEPDLIAQTIAKLRGETEDLQEELRHPKIPATPDDPQNSSNRSPHIPDLTKALQDAPPRRKRQILDALEL